MSITKDRFGIRKTPDVEKIVEEVFAHLRTVKKPTGAEGAYDIAYSWATETMNKHIVLRTLDEPLYGHVRDAIADAYVAGLDNHDRTR